MDERRITYDDITDYLSEHLPYSPQQLQTLLIEDIKKMRFHSIIWNFAMKGRPEYVTAIATINNDVFSEFVVPEFNLNSHFDIIINSSDYGITDKVELCHLVMEHCKIPNQYENCLLIDDSTRNVRNFIQHGGYGHIYHNDKDFGLWLKNQTVLQK